MAEIATYIGYGVMGLGALFVLVIAVVAVSVYRMIRKGKFRSPI